MRLFNKSKKVEKLDTITLKHYKLKFQTIDGKEHEFNKVCYIDEDAITCSALEFYLIDKKFLKDDAGIYYPIQNIISIKFELNETINVVKKYLSNIRNIWYSEDEIENIKIVDNQ